VSRYALVTGAGGDLGRAACAALAEDGWSLLITDHPTQVQSLDATRDACAAERVEIASATFDVTEHDAVADAIGMLAARHGVPTALVANAGVQGEFAPVHEHGTDALRRVLDVNVVGVFNTVQVTAGLMIGAQAGGSIITMASMAGVNGAPNMPAYAASKAAVIGLAKSASRDLAPHGIRVNAVSPGFIGPGAMWDNQVAQQAAANSPYYATDPDIVARQMIDMVPLRRRGAPSEVADVICYLAGNRSSYLTGINIEIAGGAL
jgi:NAD(P)-dependent dehydrogenase (short-subunit alcohol dehydrogenase family)